MDTQKIQSQLGKTQEIITQKPPHTLSILGFTLVELIVVITILSILGTIGFISIGSYSSKARDSNRTTDMVNLAKGLEILLTKGSTLPEPDANMITLTASGTPIGYQGYAGTNTLRVAGLGGKFQDPLSNMYYTYTTNTNRNKYQILGLLENGDNLSLSLSDIPGIATTFPGTYDTRFPLTKGSSLGILLGTGSSLNQPVQEYASFTGIDLTKTTTSSGYTLLFAQNDQSSNTPTTGNGAYTGSLFTFVYNEREDLLKDKTLASYDPSLAGYWDMETLTGTLLKDLSGYGNNGVCYDSGAGVGCYTKIVETDSKSGKSITFNGGDYIRIPPYSFGFGSFTFIIKYNLNTFTGANYISHSNIRLLGISDYPTGNWLVIDVVNDGNFQMEMAEGSSFGSDNASTNSDKKIKLNNGETIGIVVNRNIGETKYFFNGSLDTKKLYNSNFDIPLNMTSPLYIGGDWNNWNGTIDEIRIYNRALSDSEISTLYNTIK